MRLSVIVVSWNVCRLLRRSLETLYEDLQHSGLAENEYEVFVVDNASGDGSAAMVAAEYPAAHLIANEANLGFAAANNQALRLSKGRYVLLLNPDTEVLPGALPELLRFLSEHSRAGVVAPQLLNSDGSIQRSCRAFPTFAGMLYELLGLSRMFPHNKIFGSYKMLDFDHRSQRLVDQPEGACLLIRRQVIEQVGMLDEGYFMLFEEVDWCYRIIQDGWEIWFDPAAQVVHHFGQSIKQVKTRMIISSHRGLFRFWNKHYCRGRWYLRGFVYAGLMSLAWFRIGAYSLKKFLRGGQALPT